VNNKETEIYRADYALRAIKVPAGTSNVIFSYDPMSFKLGLIIFSAATGVIVFALLKNKYKS
jgi:uncharacterized membrane protein YfhO